MVPMKQKLKEVFPHSCFLLSLVRFKLTPISSLLPYLEQFAGRELDGLAVDKRQQAK